MAQSDELFLLFHARHWGATSLTNVSFAEQLPQTGETGEALTHSPTQGSAESWNGWLDRTLRSWCCSLSDLGAFDFLSIWSSLLQRLPRLLRLNVTLAASAPGPPMAAEF